MNHVCPKCGSTDVMVGAFVLRCMTCDWSYLNEYPCHVCGKPSYSSVGINNVSVHGCREHPATMEACQQVLQQEKKS